MIDAAARTLLNGAKLTIVDIGARHIEGHDPPYRQLVEQGMATLVAFEPDEAACKTLIQLYPGARIEQTAIADGKKQVLYVTEMASKSSIFKPNPDVIERYQTFSQGMKIVERRSIETKSLDDALKSTIADYILMDIQGAELLAIRGGEKSFSNALVVETEVEFVAQYCNQPLFGDIDIALRRLGLQFHRFTGYATRTMRPVLLGGDPTAGINQWLWADAAYFLAPNQWPGIPPKKLRVLAAIMHHRHSSWDIAYAALKEADLQDGEDSAAIYLEHLGAQTATEGE